jgi:hypothetical protein
MSYNPYGNQSLTFENEQAMRSIANKVYAEKQMTTTWYMPQSDQYWAAENPHSESPSLGWAITKPGEWSKARSALKTLGGSASSTDKDHYSYQPFTDEALPMAVNFNSKLAGGTITTQDYPLMTDTFVDTETFDLVNRDFILLQAVTRKAWDKLTYTADDRTPFRNTFGLAELDTSPSRSISYSTTTINLKKAQGHVSASRWLDLAIRRRNIRQENESAIDNDFERGFVAEMLTTLATATDNAVAGAWDIVATGAFHMTNDPYADIYTDATTIRTAGGKSNTLIMNSQTYYTLGKNSWMRTSAGTSVVSAGPGTVPVGTMGPITHPALPGYRIFIEETVAKGDIFILDSRSALWLDGPRSTRIVEDNAHNVVDTYSDYWYGSGLRVSTFIVQETGTVT